MLRRSHDGTLFSCSVVRLLRCAHKRIADIMKVHIERKNMQVELIRFRKKMSTLFTFTFANRVTLCLQHIR